MGSAILQLPNGEQRVVNWREGATRAEIQAEIDKAKAEPTPIQPGSAEAESMSHDLTPAEPTTPLGPLTAQSLIEGITGTADLLGTGLQAKANVDTMLAEALAGRQPSVTNPLENIQPDMVSQPLLDAALGEGVRYQPSNTFQEWGVQGPARWLSGELSIPGLGLAGKGIRSGKEWLESGLSGLGGIAGEELVSGVAPDYDFLGAAAGSAVGGIAPLGPRANNNATVTQLMFGGQQEAGALRQLYERIRAAAGSPARPRAGRVGVTDDQFRSAAELMKFSKENFGIDLSMDQALAVADDSSASTIRQALSGHTEGAAIRDVLSRQTDQIADEGLRRIMPSTGPNALDKSLGDLVTGRREAPAGQAPEVQLRNRREIQADVVDTANATSDAVRRTGTRNALHQQEAELVDAIAQRRQAWEAPGRRQPVPPHQAARNLGVDGVAAPPKTAPTIRTMREGFWQGLEAKLTAARGNTAAIGQALTDARDALIQIPVPKDPAKMTSTEAVMYLHRLYGLKELGAIGAQFGFSFPDALSERRNLVAMGLRNNARQAGGRAVAQFDLTAMGQNKGDKRYDVRVDEAQGRALDAIFRGANPALVTEFFQQFKAAGKGHLAEEAYLDYLTAQVDRSMKVRSNPGDVLDLMPSSSQVDVSRGRPADDFLISYWNNMFSTEGQRQSLARAMTEIGANHGLSPEQARDLTHGFAQYMSILALAAPSQGMRDIRLSQIRENLGASVFRHIGQVSVITPLRQPALAWVRHVEGNTVREMSRLLTDPDAVEELIALARTPITSHRAMGVIVQRIGGILGISQDTEQTQGAE